MTSRLFIFLTIAAGYVSALAAISVFLRVFTRFYKRFDD